MRGRPTRDRLPATLLTHTEMRAEPTRERRLPRRGSRGGKNGCPDNGPENWAGRPHQADREDVARVQGHYTGLLGFDVVTEFGPTTILSNGEVLIGLSPAPDASDASSGDRFDENRVGLDHLSFAVESRAELDRAAALLAERGIPHGEVTDLAA